MTRPLNSIHPLLLLYIGALFVQAPFGHIVGAIILLFLVHSAVTLSNDLNDIDVDAANGRNVSAARLAKGSGGALLVWIVYGICILVSALYLPMLFTMLLVAVLVGSWVYNAKPFQLSKRPIGSIVMMALCYGLLPFLAGASLGSPLTPLLLALGIGFALSRASLSILKDYKDAVGDAKHHKKTFLLVYGRTMVRRASVYMAATGYLLTIILIALTTPIIQQGPFYVIVSAAVAAWLVFERTKLTPSKSYQQLNAKFHQLLSYEVLFYGAIILWLTTSLA